MLPCTVIIDNFAQQTLTEELPVTPHNIRQFVQASLPARGGRGGAANEPGSTQYGRGMRLATRWYLHSTRGKKTAYLLRAHG
jgi:hypothetical protein